METNVVYYPLTHPQKGIWYTEKLYPGTSIATISATLKLYGDIDYALLEEAINIIIKENDSLRSEIVEKDGIPLQYIKKYKYQNLKVFDFSNEEKEKLFTWDKQQAQTPLKIYEGEFCEFFLIKIDHDCGGILIKIHHTMADAWSIILMANGIMEYYHNLKNSIPIVERICPSYIEYLKNEQNYLASDRFLKDKKFWLENYSSMPETAILKLRKTNDVNTLAKRKTFILPSKLCNKLQQYSKDNKISIHTMFICALSLYINRITDKDDIVIGTPVLNRSNYNEKNMTGMFINTVPFRIKINNDIDFLSFTQKVANDWYTILKHQKYSIDFLLKDIREINKNVEKIYDIALSYQNAQFEKTGNYQKQEGRWHFNGRQLESLYIHINDREVNGELIIDYDYLSELFYTKEIDFIHDNIIRLLWHGIDNPTRKLHNIDMVSEKEKNKILFDFNDTKADYPKDLTINKVFEEQVRKTPQKIALQFNDKHLTYSELNKEANKLARVLRRNGVQQDSIVGVMMHRSFEMIISIIAVLKAGGAYLPIEPEYPNERIEYILKDSNALVLLTSETIGKNIIFNGKLIYLEDKTIADENDIDLDLSLDSKSLAYIIYTSGSTGRPKGVMIENYSVINRINWMQKKYPLNSEDVLLQKTPFTFDVSVWELTWWFFAGAKLVILEPNGEKDSEKIINAVVRNKVTTLHFVPSMFNVFLDYVNNSNKVDKLGFVRMFFSSGEPLLHHHVDKFNNTIRLIHNASLINLYGPTETTIDVSYFDCSNEDRLKIVPIGRPIDNIQLYVLDKFQNVLPIGAVGELYISGDGLARGYINEPELTEKKFIDNPFMPGQKMYKTGDLARWFPKGDIEYLGRIDNQVKIRGYRIELGEIQNQLLKLHDLKDVVVICKDDNEGNKFICAYIVYNTRRSISDIKKHLLSNLPAYMIPSYFVELESVPVNANGKIDFNSLPDPISCAIKEDVFLLPRNETDSYLKEIWSKVLGQNNISIKDNFFDIGGDSLNAMKIVSAIGKDIALEDIYKNPTIELFSEWLMNKKLDDEGLLTCISKNTYQSKNAIICFPYGGGSSIAFRHLSQAISNIGIDYSIYSIKKSNKNIYDTAVDLVKEIKDRKLDNIIIYGHCVGCALALETTRQLEMHNQSIVATCMGGNFPPSFTGILGKTFDPWSLYSDQLIIKFLEFLGMKKVSKNNSDIEPVIKAFRTDVRKYYNYFRLVNKKQIDKITTDLVCIVGEKDLLTYNNQNRFKKWFDYSENVNLVEVKNADHYFIETHAENVSIIIKRIINQGRNCTSNAL